ncbi:MAG: hypothetical protein LBL28_05860 [Treponema sp.]|jgi:hypothetical protein|nr:hypothetical protein [Treponema sp.]
MKRTFLFFLVLVLACGFLAAQEEDEGTGLSAGLEVGINNATSDDGRSVYLMPNVVYEKSFDDLDVFVEGDYTIEFDGEDAAGEKATIQTFYLEEELGYNLHFGDASTLTLILNNALTFNLGTNQTVNMAEDGTLDPALKFTQGFDFGDLYGQIGFPIGYPAAGFGLEFIVGCAAGFGLGAELTCTYSVEPEAEYSETSLLLTYENGPIYGEVEVAANGEFKVWTITPEFDYSIGSFTLYVGAELGELGNPDEDFVLSPFLGVSYSF